MKLYYTPGACSLAAHIILNEVGIDFDLVKVDLATHQTETGQDYYTINPKGSVPALEINSALILTENVAVLPYLAEYDPKQDLMPPSGFGRAKVLEWLGFLNSELHKSYSPFFRGQLEGEVRERAIANLEKKLQFVEDYLAEVDTDYLVDDNFGPADAYLFVITSWSKHIGHDLRKFTEICDLRKVVGARQSVQIAMRDEHLI